MSLSTLFLATLVATATAQSSSSSALIPLASRKVDPKNIPYQVVGDQAGPRGPQAGYNLCNSTTEGANSMCQTSWISDPTDFCIWSSPKPNDLIGNSEAYEVAWCTKPGRGARLIPPGTFSGLQWLYAKNYVQIVGYVNQANLNLDPTDLGGELDPHGADEQGNPLGGILFSSSFGDSSASFSQRLKSKQNNTAADEQVIEWVQFIGNGMFCAKACKPDGPNPAQLCNHIYDEIGCAYNAVADYTKINGTYEICDSDDMTPPGVFTTAPGQTTTWFQPFTGNPSPPYTPNPIASSNCQTFASTDLFLAAPTSAGAAPTGSTGATGSRSGTGAAGPTATGGSGSAGNSTNGGNNSAAGLHVGASLFVVSTALLGGIITVLA